MKELTKTKKLSVSVIGYLAILLIGFLSIQKPDYSFSRTTHQMVAEIESLAFEAYPEDVETYLVSEKKYVFIDIRNTFDFQKGNIDGAINIPSTHLFEKININQLRKFANDSLQIIIYGNNQEEANAPWMILYQMGFSNLKVLMGGYSAYIQIKSGSTEVQYFIEEPIANFAEAIKNAQKPKVEIKIAKPEVIVPVEKVKNDIEEGGC